MTMSDVESSSPWGSMFSRGDNRISRHQGCNPGGECVGHPCPTVIAPPFGLNVLLLDKTEIARLDDEWERLRFEAGEINDRRAAR